MATTYGAAPDDDGIQALFNSSPDAESRTSAAAETAFLLGLIALGAAPFAVMHVVALGAAAVAVLLALVGVATTSRPNISGRALAPLGLAFAVAVLVLLGLRYLGLDTAFGDPLVPTLGMWLESLNAHFPRP